MTIRILIIFFSLLLSACAIEPPQPYIPPTPQSYIPPPAPPLWQKNIYPVWFGTTRKPIDEKDLTKGFGDGRDNKVHYGKCNVFIPESHNFGAIDTAWYLKYITQEDGSLKLRQIISYNKTNDFWSELKKEISENKGDALIFLHGYNNTFEESAIRAAQIGVDLKISGATAFFSWASKGKMTDYPYDEESIELSEEALGNFLIDFSKKSGASKVHIIAHSMGNKGLIRALKKIQLKLKNSNIHFGQIILAAPDINIDEFKQLAYLYPQVSERTTLYVSPKDKALGVSTWLHNYQRVGITPPVTVFDGIDTIKVDVKNFNLLKLGHSYYAESEGILHDIFDLLNYDTPPSMRQQLKEKIENGKKYWVINNN